MSLSYYESKNLHCYPFTNQPFNQKSGAGHMDPASRFRRNSQGCRGRLSIGGKGYIGTSSDASGNVGDFWEYDPSANTWTRKADFPGAIGYAAGFSIGSKGYIGTGNTTAGSRRWFAEYDPATDTWTRKAHFPGGQRHGGVGFSIGDIGYLGLGPRAFWPCQLDRVTKPPRNARSEAAISAALLRG
jgi:hypothetical protein